MPTQRRRRQFGWSGFSRTTFLLHLIITTYTFARRDRAVACFCIQAGSLSRLFVLSVEYWDRTNLTTFEMAVTALLQEIYRK